MTETATQLEEDIEGIRNHLSDVAGELDRPRHRMVDLPGQLRRRAKPIAIGTVALAAVGLGIWFWRSRSRRGVPGRLLSMLPATVRSGEWLEDVRARVAEAIRPTPEAHPVRSSVVKISTTGIAAAASVLAKHFASQFAEGQWPATHIEDVRPAASSTR